MTLQKSRKLLYDRPYTITTANVLRSREPQTLDSLTLKNQILIHRIIHDHRVTSTKIKPKNTETITRKALDGSIKKEKEKVKTNAYAYLNK